MALSRFRRTNCSGKCSSVLTSLSEKNRSRNSISEELDMWKTYDREKYSGRLNYPLYRLRCISYDKRKVKWEIDFLKCLVWSANPCFKTLRTNNFDVGFCVSEAKSAPHWCNKLLASIILRCRKNCILHRNSKELAILRRNCWFVFVFSFESMDRILSEHAIFDVYRSSSTYKNCSCSFLACSTISLDSVHRWAYVSIVLFKSLSESKNVNNGNDSWFVEKFVLIIHSLVLMDIFSFPSEFVLVKSLQSLLS